MHCPFQSLESANLQNDSQPYAASQPPTGSSPPQEAPRSPTPPTGRINGVNASGTSISKSGGNATGLNTKPRNRPIPTATISRPPATPDPDTPVLAISSDDELADLHHNDFDVQECHKMSGHTSPGVPLSAGHIFNLRPESEIDNNVGLSENSSRRQLDLSEGGICNEILSQ